MAQRLTKASLIKKLRTGVEAVAEGFEGLFATIPTDVVGALKEDHEALRDFIAILKDADRPMAERRRAYEGFAPLLKSHSTSEEKAVYEAVRKLVGKEIHLKVAEGYAEHQVADDLLKRLSRAKDALNWSALANVLAEVVEHHLDEEESDLFPMVRKEASPKQNANMLKAFVALRAKTQTKASKKNAGVLKRRPRKDA